MKHLIHCIWVLLLLVGCGSETNLLQPIVGNENSHFRGNSIGDKYKNVLKETADDYAVSKSANDIDCELEVDESELIVRYEFDQEKLYSIQADIFFSDTSALLQFQKELIAQYNDNYGEVNEDGGFLIWQDSGKVEFTLADESIEFGRPKLSLTIYNFDY